MARPRSKRVGELQRVPLEQVRALLTEHGLTRAQLGELARLSVQATATGGYGSSTVGGWLTGRYQMPAGAYELVRAKLWFVEHGHATLEEVLNTPLAQLLETKWPQRLKRM